ncbi:hypothetical protein J5N97_019372 [Dioscorea zingiberensis]|uniref:Profilin n=1 Tax=Dioscorea zingiberensis TaxID=325984 RepID=A0A9D5CE03_9LILI|nr:hypothetical protein J5N97_019372 [Dioscorea zingiberensis]
MSWQSYVDDHLMCEIEGQKLTSAAIIGLEGAVWAQSSSFPQFKPEELTAIVNDFNEPGSLAPTGLFLGSTKYMVIQGEPGAVIRGKKGAQPHHRVQFCVDSRMDTLAGDQVLQQLKPIEAIKEAGTIKEYSLLAWLSSSLSFPLEIMLTSMAKVFGWLNKMLQCIQ